MTPVPLWFRLLARARGPLTYGGLLLLVGGLAGLLSSAVPTGPTLVTGTVGFVALIIGLAATLVPAAPALDPIVVRPPVRGRWAGLNSPATRVPSHGTHGFGQTWALDLVYQPADGTRPTFGDGPAFRPPTDYPGFGRTVHAPADGVVVTARGGARDHQARASWGAFAFMMLDGSLRELAGAGQVLGNHLVLDLGNGAYAVLAHLRQDSLRVGRGDRVTAGQPVAQCGNTGNSSEPHLHFQLCDRRYVTIAAGLPFAFQPVDGAWPTGGIPANGELLSP